jgi:methionine aminotransferase
MEQKAVLVPLKVPGYSIDWPAVINAITSKTKAIIINSPHNPTGAVLTEDDLQQLRAIVQGTNIFIVSDEVYEHLIFDDIPHQSILRYPDLLLRSFVLLFFWQSNITAPDGNWVMLWHLLR